MSVQLSSLGELERQIESIIGFRCRQGNPNPRVGISRSASDTDGCLFFLPILRKIEVLKRIHMYLQLTLYDGQLRTPFGDLRYGA